MASYDEFLLLLKAHGFPEPEREFQFHQTRKFKADYCWPMFNLIVEQNGGIWKKGGHSSGRGILRDYEKSNLAQLMGYRYLTFTPQQLTSGAALIDIGKALKKAQPYWKPEVL